MPRLFVSPEHISCDVVWEESMRVFSILIALAVFFGLCAPAGAANGNAPKEMTVGFIYPSKVGDAGWTYAHDVARKRLDDEPGIATLFMENVHPGGHAERAMTNLIEKGCAIIVVTSFDFEEDTARVAKKFPNTIFLQCAGHKTTANVSAFFGRMYQARYLTGMVAGSMTRTNIVGYVAAMPIPEVIRGINAFALGARSVNPKVQIRVAWTREWYDPVGEKEAAKSLIGMGADIIAQHQDSPGALEAAQQRGVYSIGSNVNMARFAPGSHLVSAIWNWKPFYEDAVDTARKGMWKSASVWLGMETGAVDISPFGSMVPQDVRSVILNKREDIINNRFQIFAGPLTDQHGTVRVPAGVTLTDKDLQEMDWLVQGVVGLVQ